MPRVILVGASVPIPYSENHSISLVDTARVCVIRSYEVDVVCGDRTWNDRSTIGRPGEGPGEFRSPLQLVRGPDGAVGVVDGSLSRLTAFDATGRVLATVRTPFLFRPLAAFDATVTGRYETPGQLSPGTRVATVAVGSQEVTGETTFRHPSELGVSTVADRGLAGGAKAPSGVITFLTGVHDFVDYTEDGEIDGTFPAEGFREEHPTPRDVDEFRGRTFLGSPPSDAEVQRYMAEPKRYMHPGMSMRYDSTGRLWVLTLRDRDAFSYLDVYRERAWLGTVQVRDRAYGFDLLDDHLVVLVERTDRDPEGLPVRAVDWYNLR